MATTFCLEWKFQNPTNFPGIRIRQILERKQNREKIKMEQKVEKVFFRNKIETIKNKRTLNGRRMKKVLAAKNIVFLVFFFFLQLEKFSDIPMN